MHFVSEGNFKRKDKMKASFTREVESKKVLCALPLEIKTETRLGPG